MKYEENFLIGTYENAPRSERPLSLMPEQEEAIVQFVKETQKPTKSSFYRQYFQIKRCRLQNFIPFPVGKEFRNGEQECIHSLIQSLQKNDSLEQ